KRKIGVKMRDRRGKDAVPGNRFRHVPPSNGNHERLEEGNHERHENHEIKTRLESAERTPNIFPILYFIFVFFSCFSCLSWFPSFPLLFLLPDTIQIRLRTQIEFTVGDS